jgi:uncharacterized protein involved in exopolysaccharide biosynthesis
MAEFYDFKLPNLPSPGQTQSPDGNATLPTPDQSAQQQFQDVLGETGAGQTGVAKEDPENMLNLKQEIEDLQQQLADVKADMKNCVNDPNAQVEYTHLSQMAAQIQNQIDQKQDQITDFAKDYLATTKESMPNDPSNPR